jgi:hypothetical protein
MRATTVGNVCQVIQLDGIKLIVTLNQVKFIPDLSTDLFSLNKAHKNGLNLYN